MTKNEEYRQNKKQRIEKIAIKDSLRACKICLLVVSFFELFFIGYWFIRGKRFDDFSDLRYFICYVFLFVCAMGSYLLIKHYEKNYDRDFRKIYILENIDGVIIILWSVVITIFDSYGTNHIGFLIYTSVLVILPVIFYMNKYLMLGTYLFSDLSLIIYTLIVFNSATTVIINFIVFASVSIIACLTAERIKYNSVERGIDLNDIVRIDPLTKLFNRQALIEIGPRIMENNIKCKTELSLVMTDIDDFKKVNDNFGHAIGDKVLVSVAKILQEETDKSVNISSCYRYGGEEFLLVFNDTSQEKAIEIVKGIMERLKNESVLDNDFHVTLSFGIYTAIPKANENIEKYYSLADELLYKAKNEGKNRYCIYNEI